MSNDTQRAAVDRLTLEANAAKDALIRIEYQLRAHDAARKANALQHIIASLERWQNTP